jgi:hypothetical protein
MENVELLFQIGWVLVPILWAYLHFRKIEYRQLKPGSAGDYFLRVWFACLFAGASMITQHYGDVPYEITTFLKIGADLIREAAIFWLVFDLALNLMRPGKAWNYVSTTNGKLFDKLFTRKRKGHLVVEGNWKLQYAAKLALIAIGELTYYLI